MTGNHEHKIAILERRSRLSCQFQISQIADGILDSSLLPVSQATIAEIVPRKSGAMGESIFNSGVCCCIVIFENEVVPDEIGDGNRPLDIGVLAGIVDEKGQSCGGESFGCAAAVKERGGCYGGGWEGCYAISL